MEKTIRLDEGSRFVIGDYAICGNEDDGYTVWNYDNGEDSETLYENASFEACVTWCLND